MVYLVLRYVTYIGSVKLSGDHVSKPIFDEESHGDIYFDAFHRLQVELDQTSHT